MTSRTGQPGTRGDDGFTLVELLLAIIIIGVITVPLADVVIGYLHNTDATTARLLASHDVQITSAYWAQDVASIGTRSTDDSLSQSVIRGSDAWTDPNRFLCGAGGTPIVRLAWDEFTWDPILTKFTKTLVQVAYVRPTSTTEMHRLLCKGSATVASDVTLAHELSTTPTVSCSNPTDCEAAPAPKTVTLNLSLKDPGNSFKDPVTNAGVYVVQLTGQRRQSS